MKLRSKYAVTAKTTFVTKPGELLSDEEFIGRLIALGFSKDEARRALELSLSKGAFEDAGDVGEPKEPEPDEPDEPKEPEPEPDEPEPNEPEEPEPEPAKPGRPRGARPKKSKK